MVVFPVVATLVSAVFSIALFRRFSRRRRLSELAWGVAMAEFAIASLAVAAGVSGGWDPTLYRLYWLFGALLNVPWLALGSIALLGRRPLTLLALVAVAAGTVWGIVRVAGGTVNPFILGVKDIPRGSFAWRPDPSVRTLASLYSIPAWAIVVLIAILSGRRRGDVRPPVGRVRANWTIAAGVTIVAAGGSALARLARGSVFSVTLAVGVAVMFVGFLMASRAPRAAAGTPPE
ncbi:MAG: hypothetical protein HY775_00830 [Acidobacteria bacterium]|nr:hypothetical protein [Acidobacteriota bacterium]